MSRKAVSVGSNFRLQRYDTYPVLEALRSMDDRDDFFTKKAFANIIWYVGFEHHKLVTVSIVVRCRMPRRPT
jgi:hypothetical protein